MKAWQLDRLGGTLALRDVAMPEPRPGTVRVRIEATPLLSYLKAYAEGRLPGYSAPQHPFTPGTNGVGVIETVGRDVWHLQPGQRVVLSPHFVAGENIDDPAQILIGLTAIGTGAASMQADWPDGTLAALHSLRRKGRLVLMGSMTAPLPLTYSDVMRNDWAIIGQFMYPAGAYRKLLGLVRTGLLDISPIRPVTFPLSRLPEAMEAAATAGNLGCVVMVPG
jgi:NADPH:quinone reductase-like Zn-dependent oxidoreductase